MRSDPAAYARWRNETPLPLPGGEVSDVGGALTGNAPPADIRTDTQRGAENANAAVPAAAGAAKPPLGAFAEALRGVKMPTAPEIQKLGTPAAPRISTAIKGGDLIALLHALNAAPGAGAYNLPSTLGAAIRK